MAVETNVLPQRDGGHDLRRLPLATSAHLDAHGPGGAGISGWPRSTRGHDACCRPSLSTLRSPVRDSERIAAIKPMNEVLTASGVRYDAWNWTGLVRGLCPGERPVWLHITRRVQ